MSDESKRRAFGFLFWVSCVIGWFLSIQTVTAFRGLPFFHKKRGCERILFETGETRVVLVFLRRRLNQSLLQQNQPSFVHIPKTQESLLFPELTSRWRPFFQKKGEKSGFFLVPILGPKLGRALAKTKDPSSWHQREKAFF